MFQLVLVNSLGPCWVLLASSWVHLGRYWALLALSLALMGRAGTHVGPTCGPPATCCTENAWFCFVFPNAHWMFQLVLGRCLNRCWAAPGHSWASIGRSWTPMLGCYWTLWGLVGAALMPVLGALKPLWGILGALLGAIWHSRTSWDPCGAHLRLPGTYLDTSG